MLTHGTEWMVDAHGCNADALRSLPTLEGLFARIIEELGLRPVAPPVWHQFPGEGGITGMVLLSESHLACHTFPESGFAAPESLLLSPARPLDLGTGAHGAPGGSARAGPIRTEGRRSPAGGGSPLT